MNGAPQSRAQVAAIAGREAQWARQASSDYDAAKKLAEQALAMLR